MGKATKLDALSNAYTTNHENLINRFLRSGGGKLPSRLVNHRNGTHPRGNAHAKLLRVESFKAAKLEVMTMTAEEFDKKFKSSDKNNPVYRLYEHINKTGTIPPVILRNSRVTR